MTQIPETVLALAVDLVELGVETFAVVGGRVAGLLSRLGYRLPRD